MHPRMTTSQEGVPESSSAIQSFDDQEIVIFDEVLTRFGFSPKVMYMHTGGKVNMISFTFRSEARENRGVIPKVSPWIPSNDDRPRAFWTRRVVCDTSLCM